MFAMHRVHRVAGNAPVLSSTLRTASSVAQCAGNQLHCRRKTYHLQKRLTILETNAPRRQSNFSLVSYSHHSVEPSRTSVHEIYVDSKVQQTQHTYT
jgi:hypothetical protein